MKSLVVKMKNIMTAMQKNRWVAYAGFAVYAFALIFLDFSFRYFYEHISPTGVMENDANRFTVLWAVLVTALLALLPRLARRIGMLIVGVLYGVLTLVHAGMQSALGTFFSFSSLQFAGEGAAFFSWEYIRLRKLFLLCLLVYLLLIVFAAAVTPKYKKGFYKFVVGGAVVLSVISAGFIINRHQALSVDVFSWDRDFQAESKERVYLNFKAPNSCMHYAGLYQYTARDIGIVLGLENKTLTKNELEQYFTERKETVSGVNEMTGICEGKNLMMVMLESIDTWMITPDIMPNLYRVQQKSVDFTNHYTPLYLPGGTFGTEVVSLTGMIPPSVNLSSDAYVENSFPNSVPAAFKNNGYRVNSYHQSNPSVYTRGLIHQNMGVEKYWDSSDMKMGDPQKDSEMLNGYSSMVFEEAFFDYIITFSGHGPYTDIHENIAGPHLERARQVAANSGITHPDADVMSQYVYAIAHAMETDAFIGGLMDNLERDGLLEDTVLLFYADHYSKYMTDTEFIKELKGVSADDDKGLYRTPWFMYMDGVAPRTITKYTSTIDIAPTIANLFGLDVDMQYYIGDDAFGEQGGIVIFQDYTWLAENMAALDNETQRRITAEVKEKLDVSFDVYKADYFGE